MVIKNIHLTRRTLLRTMIYSAVALSGTAAYAQSDNMETIHNDVPIPGLPMSLDGTTFGVMSDFHAGAIDNEGVILRRICSTQSPSRCLCCTGKSRSLD